MAHEGLNTIDPTVATRWISEYENAKRDEKEVKARHREEMGEFKDRLKSIADRAADAGLNRQTFLDEIEDRVIERKRAARVAGYSEEEAEQRELLKKALGGLPLGDWGVGQGATTSKRKRNAAAPGTVQAGMTLAEAKAILERPKGRGRPSKERLDAEKVVAEADAQIAVDAGLTPGASGAQAEAMAEAMGPDEDDRDLRPSYLRAVPAA